MQRCERPPLGAALAALQSHCASVPVLTTERLVLDAPLVADWPLWRALMQGSTARFLGGPVPDSQAYSEFAMYVGSWMLHGFGMWSVRRRDNGQLIGFIPLGLEWDDLEPELGWMLAEEARGQGYAFEAAQAGLRFALGLLGAGNFVSYTAPDNARSNRLAERLGAVRDLAAEAALDGEVYVWRHGAEAQP